jgi:hypothetical protein
VGLSEPDNTPRRTSASLADCCCEQLVCRCGTAGTQTAACTCWHCAQSVSIYGDVHTVPWREFARCLQPLCRLQVPRYHNRLQLPPATHPSNVMHSVPLQVLALGMLITGSINTLGEGRVGVDSYGRTIEPRGLERCPFQRS